MNPLYFINQKLIYQNKKIFKINNKKLLNAKKKLKKRKLKNKILLYKYL